MAHKLFIKIIQAPFHTYNIFFLQQLLYSCQRIPSSKHADSISYCTTVYPCSCCLDLCLSLLASTRQLDLYLFFAAMYTVCS